MAIATPDQLRARGEVLVDLEPGVQIGCRRLSRDRLRREAEALGVGPDDPDPATRRALIDRCVCAVSRAPRIVLDDNGAADALWVGELSLQERADIFGTALGRRPGYLAPFVPSPQVVVDAMLAAARVTAADTLYDLGCGDGRIVITAAKEHGARAVGFDYDPVRIRACRDAALAAGVADHVEFLERDVHTVDLSPATVVTLYLLPRSNLTLRPQLRAQLAPGARVVSHDFTMGDWAPETTTIVTDDVGRRHAIYSWTIPHVEHR